MSLRQTLCALAACGGLLVWAGPSAAKSPITLPDGQQLTDVDFGRHVAPLLSRLGCNGGACHGAFEGRGGLRLSLFGYDPLADFTQLAYDAGGRRVNGIAPESSLVLQKPSMQIPHGGGQRMDRASWEYQVLLQWIAAGARPGSVESPVVRLEINPPQLRFEAADSGRQKVDIVAEFADGTIDNVTSFCEFRVQDDYVATVSHTGEVAPQGPGETALVVTYRGQSAVARLLIPVGPASDLPWPELQEVNLIDEHIFSKLRDLRMVPSPLAGDTDFLRRVTLATTGQLPAPQEIRRFVADPCRDKRAKKIEQLLADPLHAALWATRFSDVTGNSLDNVDGPEDFKSQRAQLWHEWLRHQIQINRPYDQLIYGILCATSREDLTLEDWMDREITMIRASREGQPTAYHSRPQMDLYWRREANPYPLEEIAERTAAAFLGIQMQCAQCHKHPFDRWTQADYRSFANVFSQVRFGATPELIAAMTGRLQRRREASEQGQQLPPLPRLQEVFLADGGRELTDPKSAQPLPAKALGGPLLTADGDRRQAFFEWLVAAENPYFARNLVNRVWDHYFGIGLVDPVDGFAVTNPASHPELLDALARDFLQHDFDIRRLERMILNSSTFQLACEPNEGNATDRRNFSRAYVRRLPAEVIVDALGCAVDRPHDFGDDFPAGIRAVEIAPNRVNHPRLATMFLLFGRPDRKAVCDCERSQEPSIRQALFLMSDPTVLRDIREGRLACLLHSDMSDDEIVEELFLATLSRFPDEHERQAALQHVQQQSCSREDRFVDLMWSLINTREFITNH